MTKLTLIVVLLVGFAIGASPSLNQANFSYAQAIECDLATITEGVGEFTVLDTTPQVILIQENHTHVSAQIEGALMIHRLLRDCSARVIGLEAAFPDTSFETEWFTEAATDVADPVAVQILGEGEISQAEFAALVYPPKYGDFKVVGIEQEDLYNRPTPSDEAFSGVLDAMFYVALGQLDEETLLTVIDMLQNPPPDSADEETQKAWGDDLYRLLYEENPNEKIRQWYTDLTAESEGCDLSSVEEEIENADFALSIVRDFRSAAENLGADPADIDAGLEGMEATRAFFADAHDRSVVMVEEIEAQIAAHPDTPVVGIIGAAHTAGMVEQLQADGHPTTVFSPLSLCDEELAASLNDDQYLNKSTTESVDLLEHLGSLLIDSKKPPVVINEPWFQVKATLYSIAALATERLAQDPNVTLREIFDGVPFIPGISIDFDSLQVVSDPPRRYVFRVDINIDGVAPDRMFIGIGTDEHFYETDSIAVQGEVDLLELMLLQKLEDIRANKDAEGHIAQPEGLLTGISPNANAVFGTNESNVVQAVRSG